eukprot:13942271-Alexandrium_andersonii.AAC.1
MSASLVGSEMCIRDSLCAHGPLCDGGLATRDELGHLPRLCRPHRAKPVSYTHLTLPTICSV